jgi:hypothetical protein
MNTITDFLGIIHRPVYDWKKRLWGWTLPPSSGEKPIDTASPYLRIYRLSPNVETFSLRTEAEFRLQNVLNQKQGNG